MGQLLDIIPDIGVTEEWEWLTDIIPSANGTEQRISIRGKPRIKLDYSYSVINLDERLQLQEFVDASLGAPTTIPLFQYGVTPTSDVGIGVVVLQCPTIFGPFQLGKRVILLNTVTFDILSTTVAGLTDTEITISDPTTFVVDKDVLIIPALRCKVLDDVGGTLAQISGTFDVKSESFQDLLAPQRASSVAALTLFNSFPILERMPLQGVEERTELPRDEIDNRSGFSFISTLYLHIIQKRQLRFATRRYADPTDFDYWRLFFESVKGAQKPFLISSQVPDLSLFSNPASGSPTLLVNEPYALGRWVADGAFAHIQIYYTDGTSSIHEITAATDNTSHVGLTLFPANVGDTRVDNIEKISYLVKCRMSDNIRFNHGATRTEIAFSVRSTDDG